jgi:hypothetical protein
MSKLFTRVTARTVLAGCGLAVIWLAGAVVAQQPAPPSGGRPPGGGGFPRGPLVEPVAYDDRTGFVPIFDGTSLKGWDGDPAYWRVENGAIVGESTAEKPLKANTFIIWRGGEPKDFELKVEFRLNATNSGVQYRSVEVPDQGKWVLKGYQADLDFDNRWTGQLYEERGRGFLALRGQATQFVAGREKARAIGSLENADALKALIKVNDWNQFHVIARGSTLVHVLNGHVTALVIDDDPKGRALGGLIGFQMHTGPPMKVEYRNIYLKAL